MSPEVQPLLVMIWFGIIGLLLALYVLLDGFDLGVGILSLFAREDERHALMFASVGSVWDANATWLVMVGGSLFGAFPLVFAVLLPALYVPLMLMLVGLVLRAVAFGFRELARDKRGWTIAFGVGSLLAAVSQGLALGGVLSGVAVQGHRFTGGPWDWLNGFSLFVAAGVVFGYALLGATWLIIKTEGHLQDESYRHARIAALLTLAAGVGVTLWTPLRFDYIGEKWFALDEHPLLPLLPIGAAFAYWKLLRGLKRRHEKSPFVWTILILLLSFLGLANSLYPNLVPPSVSALEASASSKTLVFMLAGIGMLIPVILVYNAYQYLVFRGKVSADAYHH